MKVYFTLNPPPEDVSVIEIIRGIRELLFLDIYDLPKRVLDAAKLYDGSEAWETLWWLGREHTGSFTYCNGVVQTWSKYTLNQVRCMQAFGNPYSNRPMLAHSA